MPVLYGDLSGTRSRPVTAAVAGFCSAPWPEFGPPYTESGRVLEAVHYQVDPANRDAFLAAMREVRHARIRGGAVVWRLYEDVARPEHWTELWAMESWIDHLREETRLDETDRMALAHAAALHRGEEPPRVSRYLNVDP